MTIHMELTQQELTALWVLVVTTISDFLDRVDTTVLGVYEYCALRRFYKRVFTIYYLTSREVKIKLVLDEYLAINSAYKGLPESDKPQFAPVIEHINCHASETVNFKPHGLQYKK